MAAVEAAAVIEKAVGVTGRVQTGKLAVAWAKDGRCQFSFFSPQIFTG